MKLPLGVRSGVCGSKWEWVYPTVVFFYTHKVGFRFPGHLTNLQIKHSVQGGYGIQAQLTNPSWISWSQSGRTCFNLPCCSILHCGFTASTIWSRGSPSWSFSCFCLQKSCLEKENTGPATLLQSQLPPKSMNLSPRSQFHGPRAYPHLVSLFCA